ncbi:BPI fold-containing family B member 6, partial [Eschrichtius robustus]|nr:BPI fold-containing family B member 6 [Eschrichtius robustus]
VQNAVDESHILEKMAAEAGKKLPGMKPIKGITDLKVKDVQIPVITLSFLPGVGIFQCVSMGMTITGKSFMGENMDIFVVLNITATNWLLQDEETGLPMFKSEGCEVILVSAKTNLPSNTLPKMVNKFLDSTLHKVLPGLMCPAIDAVLVYVNKKWANLNGEQLAITYSCMGTAGWLDFDAPLPIQVPAPSPALGLEEPVVQQQKGNTIQLADAGEAEFPEDYAEGASQLLLSATLLTAELALLQKSFDVNVQEMTVTMKTGKSLLHRHGTLETFAPLLPGKAPVFLFLLEIHFNLKIQYSVREDRLQMATSLDRVHLIEKALTGFITDFLQEAYIPAINDVLQAGLPIPDFLDMNYNLAELDIAENALLLDLKLD